MIKNLVLVLTLFFSFNSNGCNSPEKISIQKKLITFFKICNDQKEILSHYEILNDSHLSLEDLSDPQKIEYLIQIKKIRPLSFLLDDSYFLKNSDLKILEKLFKKKKSREWIFKFAKAMHKYNLKKPDYIPSYTKGDLIDLQNWAIGGALFPFAKRLNYKFKKEIYNSDCPNRAIFNYIRASGGKGFGVDVMGAYQRTIVSLTKTYENEGLEGLQESFEDYLLNYSMNKYFYLLN